MGDVKPFPYTGSPRDMLLRLLENHDKIQDLIVMAHVKDKEAPVMTVGWTKNIIASDLCWALQLLQSAVTAELQNRAEESEELCE